MVAALALSVGFAGTAAAAPSDLDSSFGSGGKVTTAIGAADDSARGIAIQTDGKKVVAGSSSDGVNSRFALARYNADGSLDTDFGSGGTLTTVIGVSSFASAIAIQTDGKIVVAGYSFDGGDDNFALARYNTDGSLDIGFDGDGKVTTDVGGADDLAFAIAIQRDDKIVAAGSSFDGGDDNFALARYDANGSLDPAFGIGGTVTTDVGGADDVAFAIAVQRDDKIVAAGSSFNGTDDDFALARYNTNGALDTSFGSGGLVTTEIGTSYDRANAIAIQPDDKIVVAGFGSDGGQSDFALARYNTDGSLDTGFDGDGKVTTAIGTDYDFARAIAIQPDGKIVVAGYGHNGNDYDFALARYNVGGSLDTGFDGDGKVTTAIGTGHDWARAIAIQSDGKIVVAGSSSNGSAAVFALARYMGVEPPAPAPVAPAIPTVKITKPAHRKIRSRALKAFAGTAGPAGQVAKVEIALRQVDRRQLKRGHCLWLRNSKAKFVKTKAKRKKCAKQRFLLAKGTEKWSFKLRKRLPKGRYELYARVTLTTGERHTTFTKTQGNLRTFTVT